MNSEIRITSRFRKEAKRLSKKYPSLKWDLEELFKKVSINPKSGTPLGKNFFIIRLQISSEGKGKSGGARVITHLDIAFQRNKSKLTLFI